MSFTKWTAGALTTLLLAAAPAMAGDMDHENDTVTMDRYEYFGVKAAQQRVRHNQNGIIWHTQGSGKSLTMVWLAKWVRENITDARVLIITDRAELDEQIEKVFKGVDEHIYRLY